MATTLEQRIPQILLSKLHRVFNVALSHGSALHSRELRIDLFVAFCKESRIVGVSTVTRTYLTLIWGSFTELHENNAMNFSTFLSVLVNVAFRVCGSHGRASATVRPGDDLRNLDELYEKYLDAYVSRFTLTVANCTSVDPFQNGWPTYTNLVITHCVRCNMIMLRSLFDAYQSEESGSGVMNKQGFLTMCKDQKVIPQLIQEREVSMLFDKASTDDTYRRFAQLRFRKYALVTEGSVRSQSVRSPPDPLEESFRKVPELELDHFVDLVVLLALKSFGKMQCVSKYGTMQGRVVAFFQHINPSYIPLGEDLASRKKPASEQFKVVAAARTVTTIIPLPTMLMPSGMNVGADHSDVFLAGVYLRRPSADDDDEENSLLLGATLSSGFFHSMVGGRSVSSQRSFFATQMGMDIGKTNSLVVNSSDHSKQRVLAATLANLRSVVGHSYMNVESELASRVERNRMMRVGASMLNHSSPRFNHTLTDASFSNVSHRSIIEPPPECEEDDEYDDQSGGADVKKVSSTLCVRFAAVQVPCYHLSRNRVRLTPPVFHTLGIPMRRITLLEQVSCDSSGFKVKLCKRCPIPVQVSNDGGTAWYGDDFYFVYDDDLPWTTLPAEIVHDLQALFRQHAIDDRLNYSGWKKVKLENRITQSKTKLSYVFTKGAGAVPEDMVLNEVFDPWFGSLASLGYTTEPSLEITTQANVIVTMSSYTPPTEPNSAAGYTLSFRAFLLALLWAIPATAESKLTLDPVSVLGSMVRHRNVAQKVLTMLSSYKDVAETHTDMPTSRKFKPNEPMMGRTGKKQLKVTAPDNCNLLVRNLPTGITQDDLYSHFVDCTGIVTIEVIRRIGGASALATIVFTSRTDAAKALKQMDGSKVKGIYSIQVGFGRCTESLGQTTFGVGGDLEACSEASSSKPSPLHNEGLEDMSPPFHRLFPPVRPRPATTSVVMAAAAATATRRGSSLVFDSMVKGPHPPSDAADPARKGGRRVRMRVEALVESPRSVSKVPHEGTAKEKILEVSRILHEKTMKDLMKKPVKSARTKEHISM